MSEKISQKKLENITKLALFAFGDTEDPIDPLSPEEYQELLEIKTELEKVDFCFDKIKEGRSLVQEVENNLIKLAPEKIKEGLMML